MPVMRHRIGLNFAAQSEGIQPDEVIQKLIDAIPANEKMYDAHRATA